jgi:hypothetical protein
MHAPIDAWLVSAGQEWGSLDNVAAEMKKKENPTLPDEFLACQKELISLINAKKVKMRVRGVHKDKYEILFNETRQKAMRHH